MKYLSLKVIAVVSLLTSCTGGKNGQASTESKPVAVTKLSLLDSIDHAIDTYERRLDIKMKRKRYEPKPETLVTIQKWFEFGDTTRLVKLREETLTGDRKMEITQYHFIDGKLAKLLSYAYNKKCNGTDDKQCMDEGRYYFDRETLKLAQKRHAEGTAEHTPVIEQANFASFQPAKDELSDQQGKLKQINTKYASLPFPKPRPEQGTPVPVQR